MVAESKGWFSYNRRYRFDHRCQFKKWSYDWDDYMRTLHKRSLMPAAIGATAIAWIALVLSWRLVPHRGDRSDSGDYMRTSLKICRISAYNVFKPVAKDAEFIPTQRHLSFLSLSKTEKLDQPVRSVLSMRAFSNTDKWKKIISIKRYRQQ